MSLSSLARSSCEKKWNIQKARENCKTNKFMSHKMKEQLRKKFYDHLHSARQDKFCQNRAGCLEDETRKELENVLKQELAEMENDIGQQEIIFAEVLEEMNEWIIAEMTKEDDYLVNIGESDELICPMCQKNSLTVKEHNTDTIKTLYECKCGISFTYAGNMQQLKDVLRSKVEQHENECLKSISFFLEPELQNEFNNLGLMCEKCDLFLIL